MASSVTITEERHGAGVTRITFEWTGHTDGVVTGVATSKEHTGRVVALCTDPTDGPTDDYDITITDANGVDVLAGAGADRDTSNTEWVSGDITALGYVFESALTFAAANTGTSKSGVAYLFIQ